MALNQLTSEDRRQLLRFVCSFAWVDLKVTVEERALAAHLISRLELDEDEMIEVVDLIPDMHAKQQLHHHVT